jgi:hypothetical protein
MDVKLATRIKEYVVLQQQRSIPFPPATHEQVDEAESGLGFQIPEIVKSVYLLVGNGGFGPGRGGRIVGLKGGYASGPGNLVEHYYDFRKAGLLFGLEWREGLLPFCAWGCNLFSCVDCNDSRHHVYMSEECKARPQDYDLADFMRMWLDGVEILDVDPSPIKSRVIINPFTGKEFRVIQRDRK